MNVDAPAVRASYLKLVLSRCDEFGPPAAEIRRELGDEHLTHIECAGPLVWLPIASDLALQRALASVLGAERTREFLLASLREVWTTSLIQMLVSTAMGLFGLDASALARLVPRAWSLVYRDCGVWRIAEDAAQPQPHSAATGDDAQARELDLRLDELPQACIDEAAWIAAVTTMLHGLLILANVAEGEGSVELRTRAPDYLDFRIGWR